MKVVLDCQCLSALVSPFVVLMKTIKQRTACIAGKILTRVLSVYERWNFRQWQRKSTPAHSPRVFAAAKTVALVVERTRSRTLVTSCLLGGYREKKVGRW